MKAQTIACQYAPYELIKEWGIRGVRHPLALTQAPDAATSRRMVKKLFPYMSKEEHALHARAWERELHILQDCWKKTVDKSFRKIFGRPYTAADYVVSGIARDEFDEPTKKKLRLICHKQSVAASAGNAHASAATKAVMAKFQEVQHA